MTILSVGQVASRSLLRGGALVLSKRQAGGAGGKNGGGLEKATGDILL